MRALNIGRAGGLQLVFSDFGATWVGCQVPLADGSLREVGLRHARLEHYLSEGGCLGGTMGRFANRIGGARYRTPQGHWVQLPANEGRNSCHGGAIGFHRRPWQVQLQEAERLVLTLHSPDGDQGFNGALDLGLEIGLGSGLSVRLRWWAEATASNADATPVSLTNHQYLNLDGGGDARRQRLRIAGTAMLPTDPGLIPTGERRAVAGTPFDLREARELLGPLDAHPDLALAGGYDHCWLLDDPQALAAELHSADGRLALQLRTSSPALQLYGGQHLPRTRIDGQALPAHRAIALEAQLPPDAPNHPEWPAAEQPWLAPGQRVEHWIEYRFSALR